MPLDLYEVFCQDATEGKKHTDIQMTSNWDTAVQDTPLQVWSLLIKYSSQRGEKSPTEAWELLGQSQAAVPQKTELLSVPWYL